MIKPVCILVGIFLLFFSTYDVNAQTTEDIEVNTGTGSESERAGEEQLRRILSRYKLGDWIFTTRVNIETNVVPHSHPVLTLNTRYLEDDKAQLATFLHEQIHWYLAAEENEAAYKRLIEKLRHLYSDPPNHMVIGTRSDASTYLHLAVNWLEFDALIQLVGAKQARELLEGKTHYKWIYQRVLNDTDKIGEILCSERLIIGQKIGDRQRFPDEH